MNCKILFTGPVGAGKTSAITHLSDTAVVATEARATDETARLKERTTVAMDYGQLRLDDGSVVHLYGTPGQQRFSFMWDILVSGALGVVIVLSADSPDPVADLETFSGHFEQFIADGRAAIGVTHGDAAPSDQRDAVMEAARTRLGAGPVFEIDARDGDDIRLLVTSLLARLAPAA